ncbi:uncharacterized protein LOC134261977 [Saccostrea cucullata]|uniref:uncharacterized protein LOC134261977 n=1 Tax=Saccostrea cuccullata TaxID=36930 RepID=UPI002ED0A514
MLPLPPSLSKKRVTRVLDTKMAMYRDWMLCVLLLSGVLALPTPECTPYRICCDEERESPFIQCSGACECIDFSVGGGQTVLHPQFEIGTREVVFDSRYLTMVIHGQVHPRQVDISGQADQEINSKTPIQPQATTGEDSGTTRVVLTSHRMASITYGEGKTTTTYEVMTGEFTLPTAAVVVITEKPRDSDRFVYFSLLSLLIIPLIVLGFLLFRHYKRTHYRSTRSACIESSNVYKSTTTTV